MVSPLWRQRPDSSFLQRRRRSEVRGTRSKPSQRGRNKWVRARKGGCVNCEMCRAGWLPAVSVTRGAVCRRGEWCVKYVFRCNETKYASSGAPLQKKMHCNKSGPGQKSHEESQAHIPPGAFQRPLVYPPPLPFPGLGHSDSVLVPGDMCARARAGQLNEEEEKKKAEKQRCFGS